MDRYLLFACSILMISIPDRFTGSAESFDNGKEMSLIFPLQVFSNRWICST